jgi:hypothetical protein
MSDKQVLSHMSHASTPFCSGFFFFADRVSIFAQDCDDPIYVSH